MVDVIRVSRDDNPTPEARREWLVTNGLGGFASATISGEITRRYHGFLIAALPAPQGRVVMLNDLDVAVGRSDGSLASLRDSGRFVDFTLTMGRPSWRYEIDGMTIEKSVLMPARHNITYIGFRLIGGARAIRLFLRPAVNFRRIEAAVSEPLASGYALTANGRHYEIAAGAGLPVLRLMISGCDATSFTADGGSRHECDFVTEEQRGYDARGSLWSPGYFTVELQADGIATLIAATEPWHTVGALHPDAARRFETERRRRLVAMAPPAAREGLAAEMVLAADSFIITPVGRVADIVRAHAEGDEMRTVIAGYHWFTDWGRDAMISLEGLTLVTWMDAKVGDWVVTPRRGKAVEINALWYNALSLLTQWLRDARHPEADEIAGHAELARRSFNRRFWNEGRGCLYDTVDGENGDDASFRPNQIFAVSLPHPVLDRQYWRPVVDAVEQKLLTPFGLRSLAPDEPDFKSRSCGDLRARDAPYPQGTVWAWLIGPFIDAWLKVHPDKRETARGLLAGFETVVAEAGIGSISEIFDAEPPFTPRGCMAQAWSVAEVLRCLVKTAP